MMETRLCLIGGISHSTPRYADGIRDRFGGGVIYGAKAARSLGIETTVITCGADDILPAIEDLRLQGVTVHHIRRPSSNNFANDYSGPVRKLQMSSFMGEPLSGDEIGPHLHQADAYILVPTFREITGSLMSTFNTDAVVVFDGGLTRDLLPKNSDGFYPIVQTHWESIDEFKGRVTILKLSDEDIAGIHFPQDTTTLEQRLVFLTQNGFPHVVMTQADKTTLAALAASPVIHVPTFPINPVDPAGAGDTFNIGYTIRFLETRSPLEAAAFGNACASLKVEGGAMSLQEASLRAQKILQNTHN